MFFAYGRRGAQVTEMRERDIGSEYQQFLMPLNCRIVNESLGLIVHNQYAASQLEWLDLPGDAARASRSSRIISRRRSRNWISGTRSNAGARSAYRSRS
jgi:hypothetical protein